MSKNKNLTSSDFSLMVSDNSISITFEGEMYIIRKGQVNYDKARKAIENGNWNELPKLLKPAKAIESLSEGRMTVDGEQVYLEIEGGSQKHENEIYYFYQPKFKVPQELNKRILQFIKEDLPFDYLVKFAEKLAQNPTKEAVDGLFRFLDKCNLTITESGNFIAYKCVRDDFKDHRTGMFDNSPGKMVKMPREDVDPDPNVSCSRGMHAGNLNYVINTFFRDFKYGGRIIMVEIDPKNVVAVPFDYKDQKMRVCEYKVLQEVELTEEYRGLILKKEKEESDKNKECFCNECKELFDNCECNICCSDCD